MDEPNDDSLPEPILRYAPWRWKPWKRWVLASLPVLLVAYVLLIGPAAWLAWRSQNCASVAAYVYRPLLVLVTHTRTPGRQIRSYMEWWDWRGCRMVYADHFGWELRTGRLSGPVIPREDSSQLPRVDPR